MRLGTLLFLLLLPLLSQAQATDAKSGDGERPIFEITASVGNRLSQNKLTAEQVLRLDEATKISAALRVFYSLYSRWPKDIAELQERTIGIDYSVLGESLQLQPGEDGLTVSFSDGEVERELHVPRVDAADAKSRELATQSGFAIKINLKKLDAAAAVEQTAYDDPDSPEWKQLHAEAPAEIAKALAAFPDVREAYFLDGFEENGSSRFGLDVVFDGKPNPDALNAAAAAFARVAPESKTLQLVLMTPDALAQIVEQAQLQPIYRRP